MARVKEEHERLSRRINRFLRRKPVPARFVGTDDDGEEVSWPVPEKVNTAAWSDALSVLRLCTSIAAYDDKGGKLRVIAIDRRPELDAEADEDGGDLESAAVGVAASTGVKLISVDVPKLVDNIARNMRELAREVAQQNSQAYKEGFTALVQCVNVCINMLARIDDRLAQAEEAAALNAPPQAPQLDSKDALAMMALQRAMGGGVAPTNGAAPNGAGGLDVNMLMKLAQTYMASQPKEGGGNAE